MCHIYVCWKINGIFSIHSAKKRKRKIEKHFRIHTIRPETLGKSSNDFKTPAFAEAPYGSTQAAWWQEVEIFDKSKKRI